MTATPRSVKSLTQVNTTDTLAQIDGQVASLNDGGYVVVWTDSSLTYNPSGTAIVAQRYDAFGNKVGGEVKISQFSSGDQLWPTITALPNGNVAIAFADTSAGNLDLYVRVFRCLAGSGQDRHDRREHNRDAQPVDHGLRRRQLCDHLHGRFGGRHRHRGARGERQRDGGRPVRYRQSNRQSGYVRGRDAVQRQLRRDLCGRGERQRHGHGRLVCGLLFSRRAGCGAGYRPWRRWRWIGDRS
jgi:hypothetical protein